MKGPRGSGFSQIRVKRLMSPVLSTEKAFFQNEMKNRIYGCEFEGHVGDNDREKLRTENRSKRIQKGPFIFSFREIATETDLKKRKTRNQLDLF